MSLIQKKSRDFAIRIIVELKSVEEMKPVFAKQLLTYLRLLDKHVGLLVNFSANNIREGIIRIAN